MGERLVDTRPMRSLERVYEKLAIWHRLGYPIAKMYYALLAAMIRGMGELADGDGVDIEYRWADNTIIASGDGYARGGLHVLVVLSGVLVSVVALDGIGAVGDHLILQSILGLSPYAAAWVQLGWILLVAMFAFGLFEDLQFSDDGALTVEAPGGEQ